MSTINTNTLSFGGIANATQFNRYAATRGLLYSHVGWIFYKPTYERMELVDRKDLDSDPGMSISMANSAFSEVSIFQLFDGSIATMVSKLRDFLIY